MPATNDAPLTIAISRAALIARLERALHKQGRELRSYKPLQAEKICCHRHPAAGHRGDYTDLVQLGRYLGCLEPWEQLAAP
jgi:hypothetical protein